MVDTKSLFCFGYGYSCDYLGHALQESGGWNLSGTTRDSQKRDDLRARGIDAHIFDYKHPLADPRLMLKGATHVLISTPPNDDGDPSFQAHVQSILKTPGIEWVGYLSTTGVYGNRDGGWVSEDDACIPTSKRGQRRLQAEREWLSLLKSDGLPVHIFRLAGIYGPGRSALDSIRAGVARRIDKPGHAFNRIHVEDIVQVLMASMQNPNSGAIYNVCDDYPSPSQEVIAHACEMLGRPVPDLLPYKEADLAPITRSFYADNKRVKNDKIKQELGVQLKYPSFKEGLKACRDAENYAAKTLFSGMGA